MRASAATSEPLRPLSAGVTPACLAFRHLGQPPCPLATRSNILLRLVPVSTTSMGASVSNPNFSEPEKEPGSAGAVLIADDDPAIRLVLRHRLEADGMRVEEAGDSATALAALRANRFDVALLDIIMPGTGGLEVPSAPHAPAALTPTIL